MWVHAHSFQYNPACILIDEMQADRKSRETVQALLGQLEQGLLMYTANTKKYWWNCIAHVKILSYSTYYPQRNYKFR